MKLHERRAYFRKGLHALYLPVYDALCENLDDRWQPYCGKRSPEAQATLYGQGRARPGLVVTNAQPWESPHNYGCASDWTVWKSDNEPLWPKDADIWEEYQQAVDKAGAQWGGDWEDKPHNELFIEASWKAVKKVYDKQGLDAAMKFVADSRIF